MRPALKVLCLAAAMAACPPAWAELVTFEASFFPGTTNSKSTFTITFDNAGPDTDLTFNEIAAFSGLTANFGAGPTYNVLDQIAAGIGPLTFGGKTYNVIGGSRNPEPGYCALVSADNWCFSQNPGTSAAAISSTGWGVYSITGSTAVPEPGSLALLGVALAGLTLTRRRKQKH